MNLSQWINVQKAIHAGAEGSGCVPEVAESHDTKCGPPFKSSDSGIPGEIKQKLSFTQEAVDTHLGAKGWSFVKYSTSDSAPIWKNPYGYSIKFFQGGKWTMRHPNGTQINQGEGVTPLYGLIEKPHSQWKVPPPAKPVEDLLKDGVKEDHIEGLKKYVSNLNSGGSAQSGSVVYGPLSQKLAGILGEWKGGSQYTIRAKTLAYVNGLSDTLPKELEPLMLATQYAPKVKVQLTRVMDLTTKSQEDWKGWAKQDFTALAPMGFTSHQDPIDVKENVGDRNTWMFIEPGAQALNVTNLDGYKNEREHIPAGLFKVKSAQNENVEGIGQRFVVRLQQLSTFAIDKNSATATVTPPPPGVGVKPEIIEKAKKKYPALKKPKGHGPIISAGNYVPGTATHSVFNKLMSGGGHVDFYGNMVYEPVTKASLYEGYDKKHAPSVLAWVKIHGAKNGKWEVHTDKHTAQLVLKSGAGVV